MKWNRIGVMAICLTIMAQAAAQQETSINSSAATVPSLVRYTGALSGHSGQQVSLEFSIYAAPDSGSALWSERQAVEIGADSSYTVLLGAGSSIALPAVVFATGEARWLGIRIGNGDELPRALLASVPYAMKAADAETLGGLAARTFVTQEQLAAMARTVAAQTVQTVIPNSNPSGTGTTNYIPIWTSSTNLGNSLLYQSRGNVGVGTTAPTSAFQVSKPYPAIAANGTNSLSELQVRQLALPIASGITDSGYRAGAVINAYTTDANFLGTLNAQYGLIARVGDQPGAGAGTINNSYALYIDNVTGGSSTIKNSFGLYQNAAAARNYFAGKVGIGTKTPTANLEVNGTAKFDGPVTFAPAQTFPGTGTITGITTTSPLTGSGTSGSVALGLNTSTLETTLNGQYAQLASADIFTQPLTLSGGATASQSGGSTKSALSGIGTNGSTGVYGSSDTGNAAVFSNNNQSNATVNVTNLAVGTTLSPVALSATANGYLGVGLSASATGDYGTAVGASAGDGYAGYFYNKSAGFPAVVVLNNEDGTSSDNPAAIQGWAGGNYGVSVWGLAFADSFNIGVLGNLGSDSANYSATYTKYRGSGLLAGVWGDTSVVAKTGVNGTADNAAAANFINDSASYSTAYFINNGGGGTGAVSLTASTPKGSCNISDGDLGCTGQMKSLVDVDGGARTVETYAVRSPESWSEDFGTANLVRGVATVELDPAFAQTIASNADYHVFLTPRGDSNGLYVTNVTATSFEVRESHGGTSSLEFDYRIVAKQRGYETVRLADVTERVRNQREAMLRHLPTTATSAPPPLHHELSLEGRWPLSARNAQLPRSLRPGGLAAGAHQPTVPQPATSVQKPPFKADQPK